MMQDEPRGDGGYISMSLDSLSWAQTDAAAAGLFTGQEQVSVDAWVRFDGLPAETTVLGQEGVFAFGSRSDSVYFRFEGLLAVFSNPAQSKLHDENWHYICATFDGSTVRLYIDGWFNAGQSCMGNIAPKTNPVLIGRGVRGLVRRVRIYNTALDEKTVLNNMYCSPASGTIVADFDFNAGKPEDRGPSSYPVSLQNNAFMVKVTPALSPGTHGFARPLNDTDINPGGGQVDPYSVQAWIYISSKSNPVQAVFVNSGLMEDTGMALYVRYDKNASAYRLVSQRGSFGSSGQALTSSGTVSEGTWTNVATTFDGITLSLYINGVLSGSVNCKPVPLYNRFGYLLIGAAVEEGSPLATATFLGFIRGVDVWSRALTAAEIADFMKTPPYTKSQGLQASYVFTSSPARNWVNGHPVALAEGAVLSGQREKISESEGLPRDEYSGMPDTGLDPGLMENIRFGLDFHEFYEKNRKAFDEAEARDIAAFDDPKDREIIKKAWDDVRDKIANDPLSLPLLVTRHKINGEHLLIVHRPERSYVAYRTAEENFDDCTMWKISLVFTIIAGVLDAVTGVGAVKTNKAVIYIARVLKVPKIRAMLALGASISAINIFSIAGCLYSSGMLRQLILLVLDVSFWTLIRVLGNIVAFVTGFASARIIASLVATAGAYAITYSGRPASCDPFPAVSLAGVAFDYDPAGQAVDALTIRRNYGSDINVPEWKPGITLPKDSPCAYALSLIEGKTPAIQVTLNVPESTTRTTSIQATGGGVLGAIDPATVDFKSGTDVTVTIPLSHNTISSNGVGRYDVKWNWQYKGEDGTWENMAATTHRVYVLLDKPCNPWKQTPNRTSRQLPWTDVLDYSCIWAAGAKTTADILDKITVKVNSGLGLKYDTSRGSSVYTDRNNSFLCSDFISLLATGKGNGKIVNCTDCATIVTTFANILGADVMESIMTSDRYASEGFSCNQILAIGKTTWEVPFKWGFRYHEVAWTGSGFITDNIYDACLKYDTGKDPWGSGSHAAGLPVNVKFSILQRKPKLPVSADSARYRERLAANTNAGILKCLPQGASPGTNSGRRPVK